MKRTILRCAAGLLIAAALLPTALAAEPFPAVTEVQVCYPPLSPAVRTARRSASL